ncbi:hypothetical protein ASZ78_000607 [Callipepla squamata]|uniref:DNA-directed RNA polymerase subunit n=1 Tax=Callipepla squamata TaxID=9009 RepID=A0A226MP67_CALSU|nr:hypothetical protein ASZ78_000607 [Callipepla squamata]
MFVLVEMTDTVRIPPWQFERKLNESIAEELNKKLANKVVYNVGLCICLYDITKLEDSYIFPGDGASHTKVHFRYVVFHPFLDEILVGEIKSCSQDGVHGKLHLLTLGTEELQCSWGYRGVRHCHAVCVSCLKAVSIGFFDDIVIPPESLQQPAKLLGCCWRQNAGFATCIGGVPFPSLALGVASDEAEQVWVWEYETEEGAHDLYMDIGEEIRFRVVDETFVDTSPTGPSSAEASTSSAIEEVQKKEAPYTLVVTKCIIRIVLQSLLYSIPKIAPLSQGIGCFELTVTKSKEQKRERMR